MALAGLLIAAYDGAIGPGTGTFLILTFTAALGVDFLHGSAMAKAVNVATNVGALVVFGSAGHVAWLLGAGMATANVLGARLGAHTALRRGSAFVRVVLLVVVLALLARLGTDEFSRLISGLQFAVAFSYPLSQDIKENMLFTLSFDKQSELQRGRSAVDCENGSRLHRLSPEGPKSLQPGNCQVFGLDTRVEFAL